MDLNNRRGIITGAGQGIGQALALEFAAKGAHLLLVGRKEATLQETADLVKNAGGTSEILVQDLGQADGAQNVADAVKSWDTSTFSSTTPETCVPDDSKKPPPQKPPR